MVKNHRHIGPFSREQLEQLKSEGKLLASDFVIPQDDLSAGEIRYRAVTEVVRFLPRSPPLKASKGALPGKEKETASEPVSVDSYEPPLGSFSDEDLMNNEVSRIFTQIVDSVDLVNASKQGTPKPPSRSGKTNVSQLREKTSIGVPPQAPEAAQRGASFESDEDRSFLYRLKHFASSPLGLSVGFFALLLLGAVFFAKQMPTAISLNREVAGTKQKSSGAETGGIKPLRSQPVGSGPISPRPLRLPTSKREVLEPRQPFLATPESEVISAPAEAPSRDPEEEIDSSMNAEEMPGAKEIQKKGRKRGPRTPAAVNGDGEGDAYGDGEAAPESEEGSVDETEAGNLVE